MQSFWSRICMLPNADSCVMTTKINRTNRILVLTLYPTSLKATVLVANPPYS